MRPDEFGDLEALAARDLRRLPLPRAPQTLLPRVLAAVDAWARRPWYARAWFTWPRVWQAASIAVTAAVIYGLAKVPAAPPSVVTALSASRVLWDALIEPFLPYILAIVVLMCLACAAFGVALNYVLLERVEQR
ncbi:MAG TPA: hypothetical protein VEL79_15075 [Vicinamibacterales bacterium]|nr:hypothetical protein [Vicinamibacterales bacterium]